MNILVTSKSTFMTASLGLRCPYLRLKRSNVNVSILKHISILIECSSDGRKQGSLYTLDGRQQGQLGMKFHFGWSITHPSYILDGNDCNFAPALNSDLGYLRFPKLLFVQSCVPTKNSQVPFCNQPFMTIMASRNSSLCCIHFPCRLFLTFPL